MLKFFREVFHGLAWFEYSYSRLLIITLGEVEVLSDVSLVRSQPFL